MTFKISTHKKGEDTEKKVEVEDKGENIFNNDEHSTISIGHIKEKIDEEGMSDGEKRDKRIDRRMVELEKIGVKRGRKRKIFSIIGITFMFITSLCCMYLCFILLSDIIDIIEKADRRIIDISEIEMRRNKK